MNDTRRSFIKKAAYLAGAAGFAGMFPPSIQQALAIDPATGSTYMDAEHVVILMQENRSFDHCFGTLRGVRGYDDPRAIDLPDKNMVWLQSNNKGETYAPFHLDIKNTKATWMNSLPHTWANQVGARNNGKYDNWLEAKRPDEDPAFVNMPLTLGYHRREDIPFYYAFADAFTVCDQNFCSSLTGTSPNRTFFWAGTIREKQDENSRALVWNEDMDYGSLNFTTFPERLEQNGISWKCYQNEISVGVEFDTEQDAWLSNYGDNPLEFFAQFNVQLHPEHIAYQKKTKQNTINDINELKKKIKNAGGTKLYDLEKKLAEKEKFLLNVSKQILANEGRFEKLTEYEKKLHKKAFDTNKLDPDYHNLTDLEYGDNGIARSMKVPKGDALYNFRTDVKSGDLPTVSWLVAPKNFSDHPSAPWYGAWYVSEVLDILTKNPDVWKKTIFILNYDENDGYFDHIPPFTAPHSHKAGTGKVSAGIDTRVEYVTLNQELARHNFPEKFDQESPIGLGFRVPMVIASPWSRSGFVNSEVFDHTSILQFLEKFLSNKTGKQINEPNISQWRRTICGDLTSVFRPYKGEEIETPAFLQKNDFLERINSAKFKKLPDNFKPLSPQEIDEFNRNRNLSSFSTRQEKGIRPSCPLPYELYADGKLSSDSKSFCIKLEARNKIFGGKALGSPFNIYAPGRYLKRNAQHSHDFENVRTWAYAVKAGDELTDNWPLSEFEGNNYHLRLYGPNGFFREYKGNNYDPEITIEFNYQKAIAEPDTLNGDAVVYLKNSTNKSQIIKIVDHGYHTNGHIIQLKPGSAIRKTIGLAGSHGWYDIGVTIENNGEFERRFAGHVETGKISFSDPQIGRI